MADPTIQTFCCHHARNNADMAVKIMDEFNTDSYNILCLCSSTIGIFGALYQILPKEEILFYNRPHRVSNTRGRQIIVWLAVADLLASVGVFLRSVVWMNFTNFVPREDDSSNVLFCALTSAWTQYFYTATWFWTLCYAIDTYLLLKERDSYNHLYHALCWGVPAVLTSVGLSILYIPDANCHNLTSMEVALIRILPNYCATYIPIAMVMIANPIIYFLSSRDMEGAVWRSLSRLTNKERTIVHSLKWKFGLINVVFYLCWLPNLVNGIMLWTLWFNLPVNVLITVWYLMALLNPLQALLNAIVYRRWTPGAQRSIFPFFCNFSLFSERATSEPNLRTPLLHQRAPSRLHLTDSSTKNSQRSSSI